MLALRNLNSMSEFCYFGLYCQDWWSTYGYMPEATRLQKMVAPASVQHGVWFSEYIFVM